MPNQHKPNPSLDQIKDGIQKFWRQGLNDKQILQSLIQGKYFEPETHGLGIKKLRNYREQLKLVRPRSAKLTVKDIRAAMTELRVMYPKAGTRDMLKLLKEEHGLQVTRTVLTDYFHRYEPRLVRQRRYERFRRKRFWAAGVMDMICCDQHDKWQRYGLRLHTGIDPFIGKIHWLKVWHTNKNPVLIASYYLDDAQETGSIPLVTQSDPGTENFGLAKAQTFLRHWHDADMRGYLCHRWMKEKKNVYPEISWSQLRRRFTPGFENILDHGVQEGWYDIGDTVHKLTFRWLFTPWLQAELDAYRSRINNSKKRHDKNKILPHGVPDHMSEFPELYGALDFKVTVDHTAIERARELYAPRDHPVFQLVPQSFEAIIVTGYESLGSPTITRENIWTVYRTLVDYVYAVQDAEDHYGETLAGWSSEIEDVQEREVADAEIDTLTELVDAGERSDGSYYMGGVGGGAGLEDHHENQLDRMLDRDEPMVGGGDLWEEGPPPRCVMFSEDEDDFEEGDWEDDIY